MKNLHKIDKFYLSEIQLGIIHYLQNGPTYPNNPFGRSYKVRMNKDLIEYFNELVGVWYQVSDENRTFWNTVISRWRTKGSPKPNLSNVERIK